MIARWISENRRQSPTDSDIVSAANRLVDLGMVRLKGKAYGLSTSGRMRYGKATPINKRRK